MAKFLQKQAENIENVAEVKKMPFYIQIYKIMGEFLTHEGNFKEAIENLEKSENLITAYLSEVTSENTKKQITMS